jgi:hypothetical protein
MEREIKPSTNLAQSMRDIGYTFETALADVVDNSIAAGATSVSITASPYCPLVIGILDNGQGMDESEICDALILAIKPPSSKRIRSDLGRFGMGMKTASWSQCKRITLISRKNGILSAATVDLDNIAYREKWIAEFYDTYDIEKLPLANRLQDEGTLLIWEKLDRIELDTEERTKKHLATLIDAAREHLRLVFHRFLTYETGHHVVAIDFNGLPLEPMDPFYKSNPATQAAPVETIEIPNKGLVVIEAFTLPHHNKVSITEWNQMGRTEGHLKNQGFYLYRERRLILWGTWFKLTRQQELLKLARVKIDIPNTMDEDWQINIMKSSAHPPRIIQERLKNLIGHLGAPSKRVYTHKGTSLISGKPYIVWQQLKALGNISYRIESSHPVISGFFHDLPDEKKKQFAHVLEFIAAALPIDALYSDFGSTPELVNVHVMDDDNIKFALLGILPTLKEIYNDNEEILSVLREVEPYRSNFEYVELMLNEEESTYDND